MTISRKSGQLAAVGMFLAAVLASTTAQATSGYFALGYGTVQRSLGGAGVAHTNEAMSSALNPAGVADVGREFQIGAELFSPIRGYEGTGTGFVPTGTVDSDSNFFLIPNIAYNMPLANGAVLNFAAYGNGGMNTDYPTGLAGCGSVFCGGPAGVDLSQLFLSVTYAGKSGNVSWGIAPTIAVQTFAARGLGAFAGFSTNPGALTDNGHDISYGYGLRGGLEIEMSPTMRLGIAAQTKMYMTEFDDYAGLFADAGDFDIPAAITVGMAWDQRSDLTLMADFQYIFFSDIPAIANPFGSGPLGAPGGSGFGWEDVSVLKLGAEWRQTSDMTWRFGYAYATNPVGPEDVTINILAPGIVEHHFTFGGTRRISGTDFLDFAVVYAAPASVSGPEVTPLGVTPGSNIELNMYQISASIGWTRKF